MSERGLWAPVRVGGNRRAVDTNATGREANSAGDDAQQISFTSGYVSLVFIEAKQAGFELLRKGRR
jgi:hypothetical protein